MGRRIAVVALVLGLCGCEQPQVVASRYEGLQTSSRSCTHTGYCATMMPGFDGKMEYKFKLSPHCPGTVKGVAHVYTDTMQYPSKPEKKFTRQREEWVRDTGSCS